MPTNKVKYLLLCTSILVGLNSCTIQKRSYRTGYYIDWNKNSTKNANEKLIVKYDFEATNSDKINLPKGDQNNFTSLDVLSTFRQNNDTCGKSIFQKRTSRSLAPFANNIEEKGKRQMPEAQKKKVSAKNLANSSPDLHDTTIYALMFLILEFVALILIFILEIDEIGLIILITGVLAFLYGLISLVVILFSLHEYDGLLLSIITSLLSIALFLIFMSTYAA